MFGSSLFRRGCTLSLLWVLASACLAGASATLLLEEPYGTLGWFTATGHAAVYLSGVCAETPLVLRPCAPGELGAVIARYNGVGGYDWVAVPLIPYLYAVENADDIPLFADPRLVSFLREQYRRKHMEGVAPDAANGEAPGGNWYELVGTAYDRTSYAYEVETSPQRDLDFIRAYNSSQNRTHFRTVSSNCADFAKDVINFYYPKALHRSLIADVGISTPKQMAKRMGKFSARHPELRTFHYVIPQVPGSGARSTAVHGVVESFFKSKKYMVPSALVSPIFAGCVAAVYVGTEETGRFHPAAGALVFNPQRDLEAPMSAEDRRSYQIELKHIESAEGGENSGDSTLRDFAKKLASATPAFDGNGHPMLRIRLDDEVVSVGVVPTNIMNAGSSRMMAQKILEVRLQEELHRGNPPRISARDVEQDWALLEQLRNHSADQLAIRFNRALPSASPSEKGNRP